MSKFGIGALLRALHPRARKVVSEPGFPLVGVVDVVTTDSQIPVRLFYPSSAKSEGSVGWFVRGFDYFVDGYMHTLMSGFRKSAWIQWILVWVSFMLSWFVPMGHSYLPNCTFDPPVREGDKCPLIIFSHGLTGTGQ